MKKISMYLLITLLIPSLLFSFSKKPKKIFNSLEITDIENYQAFSEKIKLSEKAEELLKKNGFVVIDNKINPNEESMTNPYKLFKKMDIPIFVTSASLLHLYHIQFDETLKHIEEKEFFDDIWQISSESFNYFNMKFNNTKDKELKDVYKRNATYFTVALELLKVKKDQIKIPKNSWESFDIAKTHFLEADAKKYKFETPKEYSQTVQKELKLIKAHSGFSSSPNFIYKEDYSQYIPRGHYTQSEKLKNYFKGMMWYGRISMLIKGTEQVQAGKGCDNLPPCTALISKYDAKIQTIQALEIASLFNQKTDLMKRWEKIYEITSFYVGFSDDLGPQEYIQTINSVFGRSNPNYDDSSLKKIKEKLVLFPKPEIYGGTGDVGISPPFSDKQLEELLSYSQGFRLMGQRFIPDSYMFQNLVFPKVDKFLGKNTPFTLVQTDMGPTRGFPRGLDVLALLGSKRSSEILKELGDSNYEGYKKNFKKLEKEFADFTEQDWKKNLYWGWLYSLKELVNPTPRNYPTFMNNKAWQDKTITTALASWAELRHDTILYAKQSYTARKTTSMGTGVAKPVVGYVEPIPDFYKKLLELTNFTNSELNRLGVVDKTATNRMQSLSAILEKLIDISEKELAGKELAKQDYDFIKNFGESLDAVISEVPDKSKKTTVIADVHTDGNTYKVLEEGIGFVKTLVVAYNLPDGRTLIGAGPEFSYYEFKQPMQDRLTDEKWRKILKDNPPADPKWIKNFSE
ncbi:MAG: DUF3160 domain-containing protein [Candidatus Cloacimonetes bacterium]|nr:DUF3160 domain-containing protein [Candidatus Cloacimonadota bacterium]